MKNFLLTATFSITILTLFFAPSATNLAFAGGQNQQCLDDCALDEFFCEQFLGPNCAEERAFCEAACPILECFTDFDCGLPSFCSQFVCINFQCVDFSPPNGVPCGPGDVCNDEVCQNLQCVQQPRQDGTLCGTNDMCETNVCEGGLCSQSSTACDDGDVCTLDSCDSALGCQTEPDPVCAEVGGVIVPLENTSLLVAGAQSFSWMIPVVLSVLGIGLFIVSRKSE